MPTASIRPSTSSSRRDRIKKYHFVVGDGAHKKAVKMLAHAPDLVIWTDNDPTDELAPNVLKDVVYQDEGRGASTRCSSSTAKSLRRT